MGTSYVRRISSKGSDNSGQFTEIRRESSSHFDTNSQYTDSSVLIMGSDLNGSFVSGMMSETSIKRVDTKNRGGRVFSSANKRFLGSAQGSTYIIDDATS